MKTLITAAALGMSLSFAAQATVCTNDNGTIEVTYENGPRGLDSVDIQLEDFQGRIFTHFTTRQHSTRCGLETVSFAKLFVPGQNEGGIRIFTTGIDHCGSDQIRSYAYFDLTIDGVEINETLQCH